MLHLDDWEHCDELFNDPSWQKKILYGDLQKVKILVKVEHPVFSSDKKGRPQISYIDQFPEPKNMKQGVFLQKLSDSLEESNNKDNN
jgi:protein CsiD